MAMATLLTISKDENERARLLTQEKNLTDWQSGIVHVRREGIKIGEQKSAAALAVKDAALAARNAEIAELKQQLARAHDGKVD
jgi:hypothetical protein